MFQKFLCLAALLANRDIAHGQFLNSIEAIETTARFWFPEDADFNESCVSDGCPALNNFDLCHKQINMTVLESMLRTAIGCMKKTVCGIDIDRRPNLGVTSNIDDWLPGMEFEGTVTTILGAGYLTNVSNIQFEILHCNNQTHRPPLQISMFTSNMRNFGKFKLDLSVSAILPSPLGQALSVTIPEVKYEVELDFGATMLMNHSLTGSNFDIKLLNPFIKARPMLCGLDMPEGFPSIQTLLTTTAQIHSEKSSWSAIQAAFLEKYFQSAIRITSNNC